MADPGARWASLRLQGDGFVLRRGAVLKPDGLHDLRLSGRVWPA
jgi:hypothetical protein